METIIIKFSLILLALLVTVILILLVYDIYKTWENEIAIIADEWIRKEKIRFFLIEICEFFMASSASVGGISLLAIGLIIGDFLGISTTLVDTDILNSPATLIAFILLYAIIVYGIFNSLKEKLKN